MFHWFCMFNYQITVCRNKIRRFTLILHNTSIWGMVVLSTSQSACISTFQCSYIVLQYIWVKQWKLISVQYHLRLQLQWYPMPGVCTHAWYLQNTLTEDPTVTWTICFSWQWMHSWHTELTFNGMMLQSLLSAQSQAGEKLKVVRIIQLPKKCQINDNDVALCQEPKPKHQKPWTSVPWGGQWKIITISYIRDFR